MRYVESIERFSSRVLVLVEDEQRSVAIVAVETLCDLTFIER